MVNNYKYLLILLKIVSLISITPTTKAKAVKNFPDNILLLKVDTFQNIGVKLMEW